MRKFAFIAVVFFTALAIFLLQPFTVTQKEYEPVFYAKGVVTKVVDGDTIYFYSEEGFKFTQTFKVRFADINAPELNTKEGLIAKKALKSLIDGKEVLLDIDSLYTYDKYGRVIAIVYLKINETSYMNVNYWLVLNGYAEIVDYKNEFDPYTWSLYVKSIELAT